MFRFLMDVSTGVLAAGSAGFSLSSVRAGEIHNGCLQADDSLSWGILKVRLSNFGNIHRNGISGRINDVVIENSELGVLNENGLHLNVATVTINQYVVKETATDALDIHSSRFASL